MRNKFMYFYMIIIMVQITVNRRDREHMNFFAKIMIALFLIFILIKIYQRTQKVKNEYVVNLAIFSNVWLLFASVCLVSYLLFDFLPISHEKEKLIADITLLVLTLFLCMLSVLFCRWHIDINSERIEYCSLLGKSNCRYFDRITKAEIDEMDNIYIHSENENILKIPVEIGRTYIIAKLQQHGICVKYKYDIDDFVMKLPLFYPVMYMFFSITAGAFAFFSIEVNMLVGILFWLIMFLCLINKTISDFCEKVIVNRNVIVQIKFLRKKREISFGQIVRVMYKKKNNMQYLYIYSERGLEMRINMLCKNRKLLEELVKRHHWER